MNNSNQSIVGFIKAHLLLQADNITLTDVQREDGVPRPYIQGGSIVA